ncbi:carbohydrate ABC transporter permease [Vallitalea guaymasensis]|uniref:Sugar ABC transporter permease n=1 Tax=Vallitalea guaymasensis TaxID=1185412 RepID=A0A8J8MCP9_9FIRM|nr:sugar ABC transporter permease [Vallitalea guaymasensis]QUH30409.1 sugar ABC transporter permease [Vallitalea guaymasensis]
MKTNLVKKRTHTKSNKIYNKSWQAIIFILPGLILAIAFIFYPMIKNIQISFSDYDIMSGKLTFTGLNNYKELFNESQQRFFTAYRNNILYAVVVTPITLFLGLIIAVAINSIKKFSVTFKVIYYLPVITSWIIAGLMFKYLFNPGIQGPINYLLVNILHIIPQPINWLKTEWGGNISIWILGIWKNIGYAMLLYLAALQGINKSYYEVADIEGATGLQKLKKVTIPLIKPTSFFLTIQLLIGSFNVFLQVLVLTGGDPRGKTSVLQYLLYTRTFKLYKFGEGAAIGILTAVSILIVTLILNKKMKVDY